MGGADISCKPPQTGSSPTNTDLPLVLVWINDDPTGFNDGVRSGMCVNMIGGQHKKDTEHEKKGAKKRFKRGKNGC